jgi:hypothetical protein
VLFAQVDKAIGFVNLPASLLAGLLWQGVGPWHGFGPSAPSYFGAACAGLAGVLLIVLGRPCELREGRRGVV